MTTKLPDDLIRRPDGSYVSLAELEPRQQSAHKIVTKLFPRATIQSDELLMLKKTALQEMSGYRTQMFRDYDLDVTGREGGFSLKSACGTMKVELSISKHTTLSGEVMVVKEKIDQFLNDQLEGSSAPIREIVTSAFKLNAKGTLNTEGVLGLRKHGFKDPIWIEAMDALDDAICKDSSTTYIRFYEVDPKRKSETLIPLSMAAV